MTTTPPVNLAAALATFDQVYSPRIVTRVNDYDVRIAHTRGEHVWHVHEDTDEFFLVLDGRFDVALRGADGAESTVELRQGDVFVVPRGTEHRPSSPGGAILMFEPTGTSSTGDRHDGELPGHVDSTTGHDLSGPATATAPDADGRGVPGLDGDRLVAVARVLARVAHHGQTDKAGEPYITHPERVAARVSGDARAVAVALLHDVLEDTPVTAADLADAGVPADVIRAVEALTRHDGEEPAAYYERVGADPLALEVKLADIADNADPDRLARLDPATRERLEQKYAKARAALAQDRVSGGT